MKDAGVSQWHHIQGEVNAIHKLDRHYYGMFGFLASKDNSINGYSPNPESSLHIHHVLQWLHQHNHLYKCFFSNYETLFCYVKPKFIKPLLLEKHMLLEEVLQDEAVGMAFPVDSKYFDQFPLVFEEIDIAAVQHPQPQESECRNTLQQLVTDLQPLGDGGATDLQALGDSRDTADLQHLGDSQDAADLQPLGDSQDAADLQPLGNSQDAADLQPLRDSQDAADLQPLGDSQDTADLQPPNGDATNLQPLGDSQDAADLQPLTPYLCTATPTSIYTDLPIPLNYIKVTTCLFV